jgi:hypothetical protein
MRLKSLWTKIDSKFNKHIYVWFVQFDMIRFDLKQLTPNPSQSFHTFFFPFLELGNLY